MSIYVGGTMLPMTAKRIPEGARLQALLDRTGKMQKDLIGPGRGATAVSKWMDIDVFDHRMWAHVVEAWRQAGLDVEDLREIRELPITMERQKAPVQSVADASALRSALLTWDADKLRIVRQLLGAPAETQLLISFWLDGELARAK